MVCAAATPQPAGQHCYRCTTAQQRSPVWQAIVAATYCWQPFPLMVAIFFINRRTIGCFPHTDNPRSRANHLLVGDISQISGDGTPQGHINPAQDDTRCGEMQRLSAPLGHGVLAAGTPGRLAGPVGTGGHYFCSANVSA
ncbi:hypothetical protein CCHOA_03560 [Corynebacterium choanae]|uniref:Uncharacterized protein n=1 Tax=Corynebacterium choanae TaxID=1862358 RepID=A0A3G6J5T1_9CORY|nr:hypothetical protein CCHOA_03560 [Corynebacterium choanae]